MQDAWGCYALCEIHLRWKEMCARSLHADFIRTRTQNACRFHALCEIHYEKVRAQFACRFHADAHANPMLAPGSRIMKLQACTARGLKQEARARSSKLPARSPKLEARSPQHLFIKGPCRTRTPRQSNPNTARIKSAHGTKLNRPDVPAFCEIH